MIEKTIDMIEKNAAEMAGELRAKILHEPSTPAYRALDDRKLYENIFEIYSRLGYWLLRDPDKGELPTFYATQGAELFEEGFPLHEAVQGLVVTKRHIWDAVQKQGLMRSAIELDSAVHFITILNRFFDMAIYYTVLGYTNLQGVPEA
jgi:hypothetical protein